MNKRELKQIIVEEIRNVLQEKARVGLSSDETGKFTADWGKLGDETGKLLRASWRLGLESALRKLSDQPGGWVWSNYSDWKEFITKYKTGPSFAARTAWQEVLAPHGRYTSKYSSIDQKATMAAKVFLEMAKKEGNFEGAANDILKPFAEKAFKKVAKMYVPAADTPDRKPGDNPVSPARKTISPLDTTQQGGVEDKIEQQKKIIKKFGRRMGIRTPFDLNRKLGIEGEAEITPGTIEAIKNLQRELGIPEPKVDGLYGLGTFRAHRRAPRKRK